MRLIFKFFGLGLRLRRQDGASAAEGEKSE
jgi:hypothetical protein